MLIINCKTYDPALTVKIAEAIKQITTNIPIYLAVPATDIYKAVQTGVHVLAQHLDPETPGAHTGKIIAEYIKYNGAIGTLINHSEDPYEDNRLQAAITKAKENNLLTIACAATAQKAAQIKQYNPDYIAVEPPELIGGDISVSTAQPEIITQSLEAVQPIPLLVGAGVKNTQDVKIGVQLGAQGILVASGITKAQDPKKAIEELLDGFK